MTSQDMKAFLSHIGFLTGSTAWGVNTTTSDVDFAIPMADISLMRKINSIEIESHFSYIYNSVQFTIDGVKFDVVYLNSNDFKAWKFATQSLYALSNIPSSKALLSNRGERLELFHYFCKNYKKHVRG